MLRKILSESLLLISGSVVALGMVVGGCAHHEHETDEHKEMHEEHHEHEGESAVQGHDHGSAVKVLEAWGSLDQVTLYGPVTMTRQPGKRDLQTAAQMGYQVVINLSHDSEASFDEKAAVAKAGMTYVSIPILKGRPLSVEDLNQVTAAVERYHEKKILIHCSNRDRVGAWFAYHMAKDHGWPTEKALAEADRVGLRAESKAMVIELLKK